MTAHPHGRHRRFAEVSHTLGLHMYVKHLLYVYVVRTNIGVGGITDNHFVMYRNAQNMCARETRKTNPCCAVISQSLFCEAFRLLFLSYVKNTVVFPKKNVHIPKTCRSIESNQTFKRKPQHHSRSIFPRSLQRRCVKLLSASRIIFAWVVGVNGSFFHPPRSPLVGQFVPTRSLCVCARIYVDISHTHTHTIVSWYSNTNVDNTHRYTHTNEFESSADITKCVHGWLNDLKCWGHF